jgi:heterodisulfide reductase subunit A-like polyferredoxin
MPSASSFGGVAGVALAAKLLADYSARAETDRKAAVRRSNPATTPQVLIIGCGFSGLCSAIKLQEAGIPYRVFEKAGDLGGTWYLNKYPGVVRL